MKNKPCTGKYVEKTEWIESLKANGLGNLLFRKIYWKLYYGKCHHCRRYLKKIPAIYITKKNEKNTWTGHWFCHEKCSHDYKEVSDWNLLNTPYIGNRFKPCRRK